jgi:hypothetical protein
MAWRWRSAVCTNAQCTQYEDGVRGRSYPELNIGVYYGFSTGFSFILGSDGHILIDQYQPKSRRRSCSQQAHVARADGERSAVCL